MTLSTDFATVAVAPLRPVTDEYALLPIEQGFNWEAYFAEYTAGEWYLVVFRSRHRADADEERLNTLDRQASAAAQQTPGFYYYFIGTPLATGDCLSFCLWDTLPVPAGGANHSAHQDAVADGLKYFEYYTLERYQVRKVDATVTFTRL